MFQLACWREGSKAPVQTKQLGWFSSNCTMYSGNKGSYENHSNSLLKSPNSNSCVSLISIAPIVSNHRKSVTQNKMRTEWSGGEFCILTTLLTTGWEQKILINLHMTSKTKSVWDLRLYYLFLYSFSEAINAWI